METYRTDRLAISVSEAAAVLGCSVSTVYRMIRSAQLRSARSTANGRIFVNLQSVRDFVDGEAGCAAALATERKRQLGQTPEITAPITSAASRCVADTECV
jgi:excisionase family DNA binding protein